MLESTPIELDEPPAFLRLDVPNNQFSLLEAVSKGNEDHVNHYLRHGAKVNSGDAGWRSPYYDGRRHVSDAGWTPLVIAAYWGHASIVKVLLEAGADINAQTEVAPSKRHAIEGSQQSLIVLPSGKKYRVDKTYTKRARSKACTSF